MSKNKKRRRPMPKTCDPNMCDHCMYLGEGDFVCDLHGLGPEETVFVMEDWEPTEHFLQCRRGGGKAPALAGPIDPGTRKTRVRGAAPCNMTAK